MQIRFSFNCQGMEQEEAQKQYMEILRSWPGYGSTLFDVEVCNAILSALMSEKFRACSLPVHYVLVVCKGGGEERQMSGLRPSDLVMLLSKTFKSDM